MTGLLKLLGVAGVVGAAAGAFASQKLGKLISGEKARVSKKRVSVVEVPVEDGDPEELDIVVLKRSRKQIKDKE
jgi:hypothetical protein